jgi:hypothetical protein
MPVLACCVVPGEVSEALACPQEQQAFVAGYKFTSAVLKHMHSIVGVLVV